ncbi:MAG: UMP kinase [Bacilli bacterium]
MKYKRILLKLSGEALKHDQSEQIINSTYLKSVANIIKSLYKEGLQIAIVIGAGNIYRGKLAEEVGIDRVQGDYMGMMGTIINALAVSSALKNIDVPSVVFSALPEIDTITKKYDKDDVDASLNNGNVVFLSGGTGKPYFTTDTACTMYSIELNMDAILVAKNGVDGVYSSDPNKNKDAKFIKTLTFIEMLENKLQIMDLSAIELIKDKDIEVRIFSMDNPQNFLDVVHGIDIGTTCMKEGKNNG